MVFDIQTQTQRRIKMNSFFGPDFVCTHKVLLSFLMSGVSIVLIFWLSPPQSQWLWELLMVVKKFYL